MIIIIKREEGVAVGCSFLPLLFDSKFDYSKFDFDTLGIYQKPR